jgi:transposase, IS30 family
MTYKHVTRDQRVLIQHSLLMGTPKAQIAREIGVHRSTLTREPKRNTATGLAYTADIAAYHAEYRRSEANGMRRKILPDSPLETFVRKKLRERWSPDEIAKRWNDERKTPHVCAQTIYAWIESHCEFRRYLLLGRKRRRKQRYKKVMIPNKRMIDTRPAGIESRKTLGHWEGDTIVSKCKRQSIATHVERESGYLLGGKMEDRTAKTMHRVTTEQFRKHCPKQLRRTCTNDNGSEFALHGKTERNLSIKMYFAFPYHSWERGTNENTNRLIRAFFPKSLRFEELTQEDVDRVVHLLNHRPRKRLGYRTPHEVFRGVTECCTSD